jgi:predicted neutral ceramidase superfamily lipid hydrolase
MFTMTGDRKCKNNVMGKSGIAVLDSVTSFYGFVLDDDSHFENFFVQVERPFEKSSPHKHNFSSITF